MRSAGGAGVTLATALAVTVGSAACGPDPLPDLPAHTARARSTQGMVVTGSPHATEAGRRMLAAGGNAVDAAVAAAFALAVAEPTQSGLGGRTQILLRRADGSVHALDGTTQVPAGYGPSPASSGEHGLGAVAIPGTVAALTRVLEEHGSLSLTRVVEPARRWAADGLVLTRAEAGRLEGIVAEVSEDSEVARIFGGVSGDPAAGEPRLVQPELAGVLERIARDGRAGFYEGVVAERMVRDMVAHGGFVRAGDLSAYRALDAPVGRGHYRGYELVGSYLPASGVTLVEILQIADALPPAAFDQGEAAWAATLARVLLAGFDDREAAERRTPASAVAWLTSDSLASRRAAEIAAGSSEDAAPDPESEPAFTTHVSVADTFGNVVALTQSLGPTGGARVVTPGLGFLYASTLGGYLAGGGPGYRPWSSQTPFLILDRGEPWLVLGGAGARRILSALAATLTRMVDQGRSLDEALAAPRLHPTGGEIRVREGWPAAAELSEMGFSVAPRGEGYFARLNVVEVRGERFRGWADRRWRGASAAGPEGPQ